MAARPCVEMLREESRVTTRAIGGEAGRIDAIRPLQVADHLGVMRVMCAAQWIANEKSPNLVRYWPGRLGTGPGSERHDDTGSGGWVDSS